MMKKYSSKIDIISIGITLVVLLSLSMIVFTLSNEFIFLKLFLLLLMFCGIGLALCYFPIQFIITAQHFIIVKAFSKKKIPLASIEKVSLASPRFSFYSPSSMNAFNSRGFFGYLGKTPAGHISYATAMRDHIWIKPYHEKQILISVRKKQQFLADLTTVLKNNA